MKRRNLVAVLTCSFFILAIVVTLISSGVSQSTGKGTPVRDNALDSTRKAYLAAIRAADTADTSIVGWLILDGRLIPGPYQVTVEDSLVLVNDLVVFGIRPPRQEIEVDSNTAGIHRVSSKLLENFHGWCASDSIEVARKKALEFIRHQSLVDTAYLVKSTLTVRYKGTRYPENYMLQRLQKHTETRSERRRRIADFFTEQLQIQLRTGGLIILENGRYHTIPYPKSKAVIAKLREIAGMVVDLDERISVVQKVIGKDWPARKIAEYFAPR